MLLTFQLQLNSQNLKTHYQINHNPHKNQFLLFNYNSSIKQSLQYELQYKNFKSSCMYVFVYMLLRINQSFENTINFSLNSLIGKFQTVLSYICIADIQLQQQKCLNLFKRNKKKVYSISSAFSNQNHTISNRIFRFQARIIPKRNIFKEK